MTQDTKKVLRSSTGRAEKPYQIIVICLLGILSGAIMAVLTLVMVPVPEVGSVHQSEQGLIPEVAAPGSPAPDFQAKTLDGELVHLNDFRGSVVALNFWATWCPPCLVELPALQAAQEMFEQQGFKVVAVNAGEPHETVSKFIDSRDITFLILLDPEFEIVNKYNIRAFPTTIWITANGDVEAKHFGPLDLELIDQYIWALLGM